VLLAATVNCVVGGTPEVVVASDEKVAVFGMVVKVVPLIG